MVKWQRWDSEPIVFVPAGYSQFCCDCAFVPHHLERVIVLSLFMKEVLRKGRAVRTGFHVLSLLREQKEQRLWREGERLSLCLSRGNHKTTKKRNCKCKMC